MSKIKQISVAEFNKKFVGKKVLLSRNTSGGDHSVVGTKVTILRVSTGSNKICPTSQIHVYETGSYYYYRDFDWNFSNTIEELEKDIEDLIKEKEEIDSEINSIKLKIEFMKDNKLKEFDEDTFKAFAILKELKKSTSDIQKAKLISKIIKGS